MIVAVRDWFLARSQRERYLVLAMLAIAAPLFAWLLIVRPVTAAYQDALRHHVEAIDRHGRVLELADALKRNPGRGAPTVSGDLALLVTEAATQAGIALQSATPSGTDAVDVSVTGGAAIGLSQWFRETDARGLSVDQLRMTPLPDGSVSMTARITRAR